MYHGTSTEAWNEQHEGDSVLWVAVDQTRAATYARDAARNGGEPIILRFSLPELERAGLEIALKDPTPNNQTLVARGNVEQIKSLGRIV